MLTEPEIVELVKRYLKKRGYGDFSGAIGRAHGDDLIAKPPKGRWRLHVEAKGQTSSIKTSRRYGYSFNSSQFRDHVAQAIYKAICMRNEATHAKPRRVALALPDVPSKRNFHRPTARTLKELGIGVFWIQPDRSVVFEGPWKL